MLTENYKLINIRYLLTLTVGLFSAW